MSNKLISYKIDKNDFINYTTVIYGESKTGKTTIVKDILSHIADDIPMIVIFSPTEAQNHSYESFVPGCFIYGAPEEMKLMELYRRQQELFDLYESVNNVKTLSAFIRRFSMFSKHIAELDKFEVLRKKSENMSGIEWEKFNNDIDDTIIKYCADIIRKNKDKLLNLKSMLSAGEVLLIENIDINPNIIIIFDDCSTEIRALNKKDIMKNIFTKGRHVRITLFILCHSDKDVLPEQRQNTFVSIFTSEDVARGYMERMVGSTGSQKKRDNQEIAANAFSKYGKHGKLLYIREKKIFYTFTANPNLDKFRYCSDAIWADWERNRKKCSGLSKLDKLAELRK